MSDLEEEVFPKSDAEDAEGIEEEEEEEESTDPMHLIEKECMGDSHSQSLKKMLDDCAKRVEDGAEEVCTEELFDLLEHVKHCMSHKILQELK